MLDLIDQKRKMLEFITEEKDLGVIIDHKLCHKNCERVFRVEENYFGRSVSHQCPCVET